MTQDNREYISQAKIQQEILADQKQNTGVIAVILPLLELILSLLAWGSYTALHESWWLWGGLLLLAIVFGYLWIRSVVSAIVVNGLVRRGKFHIETDYARYIDDDDPRVSEILSDVLFYILDLLFFLFSLRLLWGTALATSISEENDALPPLNTPATMPRTAISFIWSF